MSTNLVEVKVNLSGIAFDGLRVVTVRTPVIRRLQHITNMLTFCAQQ